MTALLNDMTVDQPVEDLTVEPLDSEFELDVSIVESGPVIHELIRMTDDGCGTTCESACSNSTC